ncbi:MAG: site-specific integrase, partial [Planctomycetaceae bacterium]|nr:site-specific integrase [Planctomycetaceae bacterium]
GGLRTPSETLGVRWSDVIWDQDRMRVPSPKTARKGKPERFVPLFPELRKQLDELFDLAPDGADFIIPRAVRAEVNMRGKMAQIVRKAGFVPWPRIFHNLRSTRQTELTETFPAHVVAAWMGNTVDVANKHYLQTTDAHFAAAAGSCVKSCVNGTEMDRSTLKPQNDSMQETSGNVVFPEEIAVSETAYGLLEETRRLA